MKKVKILNLYPGIGGNRKLWGEDHDITSVELNPEIANEYKRRFPNDNVIIGDAHEYLLRHYKEFDFIWGSPPCPTHSTLVFSNEIKFYNESNMSYPDMKLYQEIILLKSFAPKNCRWVIENVKPFYDYLIPPTKILARHPFWSNFPIYDKVFDNNQVVSEIEGNKTVYGFNIKDTDIKDKRRTLRNLVNPEIGKYILDCAMNKNEETEQLKLF